MRRVIAAGLFALAALPGSAQDFIGAVGGVTANVACGVLTRPNDTSAYAANDLIASSITAGSVVVPSCVVARQANPGSALTGGFRLYTNVTTGWDAAQLKVRFWAVAPTYSAGDNSAYAVATGARQYLGEGTVTLTQYGDGAAGRGAPSVGSFFAFKLTNTTSVFWDLQDISGALTPIANQTFTLVPEMLQD